jgi:hypothetical protein
MQHIKDKFPIMAQGEGVWEGEYIYIDNDCTVLDRHKSLLYCIYPTDQPHIYQQKNTYTWGNGREVSVSFEFRLDTDGTLQWNSQRNVGFVWDERELYEGYGTIRVTWRRSSQPGTSAVDLPNATIFELIQQMPETNERARVWQWFVDKKLVQRTLIRERRIATDTADLTSLT